MDIHKRLTQWQSPPNLRLFFWLCITSTLQMNRISEQNSPSLTTSDNALSTDYVKLCLQCPFVLASPLKGVHTFCAAWSKTIQQNHLSDHLVLTSELRFNSKLLFHLFTIRFTFLNFYKLKFFIKQNRVNVSLETRLLQNPINVLEPRGETRIHGAS